MGRVRRWLRAAFGRERVLAAPRLEAITEPRRVVNGAGYRVPVASDLGTGRRVLDRRAVEALAAGRQAEERLAGVSGAESAERLAGASGWPGWNDRRPAEAARLRNLPPWPRRDGHHGRIGGPDTQPRSAQTPWHRPDLPPAPEPGTRRRRRPGLRQTEPDLHVINGEGTGTTSGRRARLRSVKNPLD
ncbi:hypothetical protein [Actinoplanes solisilvae]|uniref:hypothetical protein n=1 Tax=Actinoplanes solisilvae TaxID=2486853 RepID=UPI000FD97FFB|nr:hypothetical protein [Actinoplanes solisilvae]